MKDLKLIISRFTEEEKKNCIQFLHKRNKRHDTKNIELFHLLAVGSFDINDISQRLYGTADKSALYALRKRLYKSLIDFTANAVLEDENSLDLRVAKLLLAARRFFTKNNYETATKILKKAEVLAYEQHLYALLNEIYHTQIQYAHKSSEIDLDELLIKYKQNQKLYLLEDQLNIAYAQIKIALQQSQSGHAIPDFETLIFSVFNTLNIRFNDVVTFKSLFQLLSILNISAFAKKDYYRIEPFLISTYKSISVHPSKDRQLYYHIQILYIIANTLFRNKKFDESIDYLDIMQDLMLSQKGKYYKEFYLKYILLLGLNKNYKGHQEEAIQLFEAIVHKKQKDYNVLLDLKLSLVMCYFQKGSIQKSKRLLASLNHSDHWYISKKGYEWTLKKNLIEILLHLENKDISLFDSRLLSFKRRYYSYLKKNGLHRVVTYLSFVEHYSKYPEEVTSKSFHQKVENSFEWLEYEDIFVMSFYAWLKSKMENRDLFETTLGLVH